MSFAFDDVVGAIQNHAVVFDEVVADDAGKWKFLTKQYIMLQRQRSDLYGDRERSFGGYGLACHRCDANVGCFISRGVLADEWLCGFLVNEGDGRSSIQQPQDSNVVYFHDT